MNRDILIDIKTWLNRILLVGCFLEIVFFTSMENFLGCVSSIYGWYLISVCCIRREYLKKYPLPTLVMFGLGVCYSVLPILVTLVEGKPVSFNFQVPYLTYYNQIISMTVITVAFRLAIRLYKPNCILNRLWNKIGYMTVPSEKQIWILGLLGLISLLSIMSEMGEEHEYQASGNFWRIVIKVLSGFSLAPICLYFKYLYGDHTPAKTKRFVKYYIVVLMILGFATTRRMLIFNSIVTVACIYLFLIIYNNRRIFTAKNTILVIVIAFLVTGPVAEIAMAMILNRHFGGTASQTAEAVWKLYNDKKTLHKAYQMKMAMTDNGGDNSQSWSEYYVDNIFLDRFCNLRTIDGTLYNAQKAGFGCNEGRKYYESYWINEIPSFITNSLGLEKDVRGTATDQMVNKNFADNKYSLFGCKVGGETGIGLWMFGYSYYIIALMTYIVIFYFLCSFVNISRVGILFPLPVLISFRLYWMFFLNANGIFTSMNATFARNNLNAIFIYCVILFVLKMLFPKQSKGA